MTLTPTQRLQRYTLLRALETFVQQRPGMDPRNYGNWSDYRSESRRVTQDLHDFRVILAAVERSEISAADILQATRAYSGRLEIIAPLTPCQEVAVRANEENIRRELTTRVDAVKMLEIAGSYAVAGVIAKGPRQPHNGWRIEYCTGQYFPTEYRRAACSVLACALWDYHRPDCTGESPGTQLREKFARMFPRRIARRYFD